MTQFRTYLGLGREELGYARAVQLKDRLEQALRLVVDVELQGERLEVEELVRTLLTEQMRFWK